MEKTSVHELISHIQQRYHKTKLEALNIVEDIVAGNVDVARRYGVSASQQAAILAKGYKRQEQHTKASRAMELARQAHAIGNELERLARSLEED